MRSANFKDQVAPEGGLRYSLTGSSRGCRLAASRWLPAGWQWPPPAPPPPPSSPHTGSSPQSPALADCGIKTRASFWLRLAVADLEEGSKSLQPYQPACIAIVTWKSCTSSLCHQLHCPTLAKPHETQAVLGHITPDWLITSQPKKVNSAPAASAIRAIASP